MNIFLAGATGVIGRRLVPLLRDAGHSVTGTSRSRERAKALGVLGVDGIVVDVYDPAGLSEAMNAAHPDVVINQLTDLPQSLHGGRPANFAGNTRIRIEGTKNLMAAAAACGARRVIAQSIAFVYADGPGARSETDPLDRNPARAPTIEAVEALESQTLGTGGMEGVVLRYGRLYGPGTWYDSAAGTGALHVDAAAHAALLAVTRGRGIYNLAEDDGAVSSEKAKRDLGFDAGAPGAGVRGGLGEPALPHRHARARDELRDGRGHGARDRLHAAPGHRGAAAGAHRRGPSKTGADADGAVPTAGLRHDHAVARTAAGRCAGRRRP
jgi:hypothetical protein